MDLVQVEIDRVIGHADGSYAVVVRAETKSFLVYVGSPEATAIYRELREVPSSRPFTHDLIRNLFTGFDIEVKKIVISSIVNSVYCATLFLSQRIEGADAEDVQRKEVRLDLRASDAMILSLKTKTPLSATREVIDQVEDVTEDLKKSDGGDE